ncbi:Wobble nucleotide-excising tRNase [Salegentibacter echinorum]|uniref:Wobble nucleotide-excising tRNase n=1 Tax=Salegentibacter echinorum TaxID=1073325 RepID=A0A1M5K731_SALEC|nr:AAA family ATPase [Salegentibacter echinorum]SHG48585.1 Wobble nucleotide-excising tRNase [Salegentibacter echinorum]
MITKFKRIKNLGVFKDFDWDKTVRDKNEDNIIIFKKLNILYGRNYSGKTTLSRIVRALETGQISDKYEDPECCISLEDSTDVTQVNFTTHSKTVRVFNEDFIEDNLKFIFDPNESVEAFAILGEGNNEIEKEIEDLKKDLGSNKEDSETGFYKDLKTLKTLHETAKNSYSDAEESLNKHLKNKATGQPNGIKYQSKYEEVNYNINKLKLDIESVKTDSYQPLNEQEESQAENVLKEETKDEIPKLESLNLRFSEFQTKASELVNRKIGQSDKIQELAKDAVLNRWVKEGKELHQDNRNICSFCNNPISEERWGELDKHFDEESDKLEKDINDLVSQIDDEKELLDEYVIFTKDQIYSKFRGDFYSTKDSYITDVENYISSLELIKKQLISKKKNILNHQVFTDVDDFSADVENTKDKLEEIRTNSNEYSSKLDSDQNEAKKKLRLKEVHDFINDIRYDDLITELDSLAEKEKNERNKKDAKQDKIDKLLKNISEKQKELKDESKGADKVNEYLNDHFGHEFLTMKAIEFEDEETGNDIYRFEIRREGKKAYHLSEGEKSLIAFCYFVAKLQDIATKEKNPIIWIDDPISSLDGNHIFFIYSLLKIKIYNSKDFEQIFISTHNLNFFKYLQRLPSHNDKKKDRVRHFIIERKDKISIISEMPDYIKRNVTEFNHLFKQIVDCSNLGQLTDQNYTLLYNFGNNARKFFEIYLFYKYPDASNQTEKMRKFFGEDEIPTVLTDRINNEYSHLAGTFERGQQPIEVPEMKKAAELIVKKLENWDKDQFDALMSSVQ